MKANVLRGKILEFLRHIYPEGADERTVVGVFYEYYEYDAILQALSYMADKGYLSKTEVPHPFRGGERVRIYKAAPAGIDLVDGTITDPAVSVLPEGK